MVTSSACIFNFLMPLLPNVEMDGGVQWEGCGEQRVKGTKQARIWQRLALGSCGFVGLL